MNIKYNVGDTYSPDYKSNYKYLKFQEGKGQSLHYQLEVELLIE